MSWNNDEGSEPESIGKVTCVGETDKALKVRKGFQTAWVPKSVVSEESEVQAKGDEGELFVAKWFADKNELI